MAAPPGFNRPSPPPARTKISRKHIRRKKGPFSRFVQLSRRIVDDTLICRDEFEFTGSAIDPSRNGCLASDQQLQWAFGDGEEVPVGFTEHPFTDVEDEFGLQLVIQPIQLYLGGYTPLFKQFFTPLGRTSYLSVGEVPQGTASWLSEQNWLDGGKTGSAFEQLLATDSGLESTPFSYRYDMDRETGFIAGVGWIYDIADTTGMSQAFAQAGYDTSEKVGAVNLTLGYNFHALTLTGGYIHAIEGRDSMANFSQNGLDNDPTAWSSQLAYSTEFLSRPATFAVGYLRSSETLCHFLPEERYTTRASILLRNRTIFSLEYYQDRTYSTGNGLDDDQAYSITTKIGFQF
ncbi:MAG: LbtU family siderophore porin [Desulfobulbus sp.]|nr:LbtU family siderophore porin [Desulfobulbus sp.]